MSHFILICFIGLYYSSQNLYKIHFLGRKQNNNVTQIRSRSESPSQDIKGDYLHSTDNTLINFNHVRIFEIRNN